MLSKCANPKCSAPFLYLREGKLFRWDVTSPAPNPDQNFKKPTRKIEFFWLCDHCSAEMTLTNQNGTGVTVKPLLRSAAASAR